MKNRDDIERWAAATEEELIAMAEASNVEVPRELSSRLDSLMIRLEAEERSRQMNRAETEDLRRQERYRRRVRGYAFTGLGLAAASLAAVLVLRAPSAQPQDTFSSPEEAYAMLESTFAHIASKTGAATSALDASVQRMEDTIIDIYR